jgi:hypothetical protein
MARMRLAFLASVVLSSLALATACSSKGAPSSTTSTGAGAHGSTSSTGGRVATSASGGAAGGTTSGGGNGGAGGAGGEGGADAGDLDAPNTGDALGLGGLPLGALCGASAMADAGMKCGYGLACCAPCPMGMCDTVCVVACSPHQAGCINGCFPQL